MEEKRSDKGYLITGFDPLNKFRGRRVFVTYYEGEDVKEMEGTFEEFDRMRGIVIKVDNKGTFYFRNYINVMRYPRERNGEKKAE